MNSPNASKTKSQYSQAQPITSLFQLVLVLFLIAFGARYILAEANSSLWLDELLSVWTASGSFSETISRAREHQGQSPLFYLLLNALLSFSQLEIVLRSASLIAALLCSVLLFCLVRLRAGSRSEALLACAIFLVSEFVSQAFSEARPYSLALSTWLLSAVLLLYAERLSEGRRTLFMLLSALSAAAVIWFHFLFALALPLLILLAAEQGFKLKALRLWIVTTALLVLPLLPQALVLFSRRKELSFVQVPSFSDLLLVLMPFELFFPLLIALGLPCLLGLGRLRFGPLDHNRWPLLLWLLPPLFYYCAAKLGLGSYFTARYFLFYSLGYSILLARFFYSGLCFSRPVRLVALVVFCVLAVFMREVKDPFVAEDWRAASQYHQSSGASEAPLLFFSGLIESASTQQLEESSDFILAPLSFYPFPASGRPLPLPLEPFSDSSQSYLSSLSEELNSEARFSALILENLTWERAGKSLQVSEYFRSFFEKKGFKLQEMQRFERVVLLYFRKNQP